MQGTLRGLVEQIGMLLRGDVERGNAEKTDAKLDKKLLLKAAEDAMMMAKFELLTTGGTGAKGIEQTEASVFVCSSPRPSGFNLLGFALPNLFSALGANKP